MSLRQHTPCDDGVCPYADMHSGYWNSCEYWCGSEEPEDNPDDWEDDYRTGWEYEFYVEFDK